MAKRIFDYEINPNKFEDLNVFILQEGYKERLDEIRRTNFSIAISPTVEEIEIPDNYTTTESVIEPINEIAKVKLSPSKGCELAKNVIFGGYDESKLKFETLEGTIQITSHSLVEIANGEYFPVSYITIHFYSRSSDLVEKSEYIKLSEKPEFDSAIDYAVDRSFFIQRYVLDHSILFIDGPIIGGNVSSYAIDLVDFLHEQKVIPIFLVKNSRSNLVVDYISSLRSKFNSDLHWAYRYLNAGERTNYFKYTDSVNRQYTKIFCYIKPFSNVSPQRVEFHPKTMSLFEEYIDEIIDLIFYTILVTGDKYNPQARPISLAEMYSRAVINSANVRSLLKKSGLIPTINQERFGV